MLNDAKFTTDLKNLMQQCKSGEKSSDDFADGLAGIIKEYIQSATVTVLPGIPVTTSSGAGTTSGNGTGTIS